MVNMGEKLKSLRIEKKLTQKQVADRIGLAISAVSSYESGTRYPSYDVLVKLARIFHVSTDYLLGITNTRNIDVTGLRDNEIELVSQLVDMLRNKKITVFDNEFGGNFRLSSIKPFIFNAFSHFTIKFTKYKIPEKPYFIGFFHFPHFLS